MSWRSVQVYHHHPDGLEDLLLDAVRPVLAELADDIEAGYFTRHWLRGPHVRIQLRCQNEAWPRVRALVADRMVAYLSAHPSSGHPDTQAEHARHPWLARLEQEAGPLTPWHPDNSVQFEPYDARLHVLGTPEAAELLADFQTTTTPLAFDILAAVRAGGQLPLLALPMMFASAEIGCAPISRGFLSYRSHAEGFLANAGDPDRTRARFEAAYRRNRDSLRELLTLSLAACAGQLEDPVWPVHDWLPVARRFLALGRALDGAGKLPMPSIEAPGQDDPDGMVVSSFHRSLFGDERVRRMLSGSWFTVYRLLLNYQYLLFSRLGMAPRERFLLCYLAARTVEERYDIRRPGREPAGTSAANGPQW